MTSGTTAASLSRQVQDALPAEPDALAIVSGQIASLAIERANSRHGQETEALQAALAERGGQLTELQGRYDELLQAYQTVTDDMNTAQESISRLEGEKAALAASVRTLADRIQKLEAFKRTLIASLQDDAPQSSSATGGLWAEAPKPAPADGDRLVQEILASAKPAPMQPRPSLIHGDTASRQGRLPYRNGSNNGGSFVNSSNGMQQLSGSVRERGVSPGSTLSNHNPLNNANLHDKPPPSQLPAAQLQNATHTTKSDPGNVGTHDTMASMNDSNHQEANGHGLQTGGAPTSGSNTPVAPDGHPRVDGKDFFRQARTRLPYQDFAAFLQNIKDLNTGRQSREQTLERARTIFGDNNSDLFTSFQALLARHLSN